MTTQTYASSEKRRRVALKRMGLVEEVVALNALELVVIEVVWGQYNNDQFHLHICTPPFWNVVGDNDLNQGAVYNCTFSGLHVPTRACLATL